MSKWRCNSCGEVYADKWPDGSPRYHVCLPDVIEYAVCDADGKVTKPEKRTPRENVRNEHPDQSVYFMDGKAVERAPHPEERGSFIETPSEPRIISEGAGRTLVE